MTYRVIQAVRLANGELVELLRAGGASVSTKHKLLVKYPNGSTIWIRESEVGNG